MATDDTFEPTPRDAHEPETAHNRTARPLIEHPRRRGLTPLIAALVAIVLLGGGFGLGYVAGSHGHHENPRGAGWHQEHNDKKFGPMERHDGKQQRNQQGSQPNLPQTPGDTTQGATPGSVPQGSAPSAAPQGGATQGQTAPSAPTVPAPQASSAPSA